VGQHYTTDKVKELLKDISDKLFEFTKLVQNDIDTHDIETKSLHKYYQMLNEQYVKELNDKIVYIHNPIITEGYLHLNVNGRYEVNGIVLTSGDPIEIFKDDAYYVTFLDYAGQYAGGYYAFHFPNFVLEGAKVRVRGNLNHTKNED